VRLPVGIDPAFDDLGTLQIRSGRLRGSRILRGEDGEARARVAAHRTDHAAHRRSRAVGVLDEIG
jgi:hypothetical protein